ncbi:MAG: hypothetical protein VKO00_03740 [Cyanobacteriota bacterium]|nr:hypothetical protein [Cyanobacteriota bacterium]
MIGRCAPWPLAVLGPACASMALTLGAAALIVVPQRLAQRPALEGVLSLRLRVDGSVAVGNRPLPAAMLPALVAAAARQPQPPRLRLVPDPNVPWQQVQLWVRRLGAANLELEVQLP